MVLGLSQGIGILEWIILVVIGLVALLVLAALVLAIGYLLRQFANARKARKASPAERDKTEM